MKKINLKLSRKVLLIVSIILILIIIAIILICNIIRNNKINSQAINNINDEESLTTIFCSGTNVTLNNDVYNKIKEEKIDLVIYNDKFIAKIKNENVEKKINVKIKIKKNGNSSEDYNVEINSDGIIELKINISGYDNTYISQFSNDEFITNKAIVTPEGYTEIELQEDKREYKLAYIVPSEYSFNDIIVNKGASYIVNLNIDEKDYTYGSVKIECENESAIEIDGLKITAKEVGEYKIHAITRNENKEANLKIEQSVEKIELSSLTLEMIQGNKTDVTAKITPDDAVNKELEWKSSDENVVTVDNLGNITAVGKGNCEVIVSTIQEPIVSAIIQVEVKEKIDSISQTYPAYIGQVEGITYINGIMLVNKTHSVPQSYAPGLETVAYNAFMDLKNAAAKEGFEINLLSGYRSYDTQKNLYNNYVATYGQAEADTFSAKPGTSEHQTGLAMDVGWIDDSYGDTASGKWLAANCYKYGFIIRYPKDKESITGYKYEPWHIRYLGTDIATDVYNSGLCLEEYLGVTD